MVSDTDWEEVVMAAREAQLGVTSIGIQVLNACATQFGCTADARGVIDPETGKVLTDPKKLALIEEKGRLQMRTHSPLGKDLLRQMT